MTKQTFPMMLDYADLKIGDVVELFDGPFSTAIVKDKCDGLVRFYRPYGVQGNVLSGYGVSCAMNAEDFKDNGTRKCQIKVWQRATNLK